MFFQPHLAGAHHAACCIDSVTKKCKLWLLRSDHSADHLRATERFLRSKTNAKFPVPHSAAFGSYRYFSLKEAYSPNPTTLSHSDNFAVSTAFPFLTVLQCSLMAASRTIHHWGLPPQSNLQLRNFQSFFSYIHKKKV